ncbi:hypothetical protein SAMN05216586_101722 [Halopseudomonas aestusnigri]|uniref:Uncharacterized protein n=1 Tax=Halopseudomonas aestusnigri TaxID=857252 RepID=A0AAQ1JNY3_9GAMM|nr:hypothetical protein SAMN05216586_101722 [Halopseudomonas aestusnigri]
MPNHGRAGARPSRKSQSPGGSSSRSTGRPVCQTMAEQELGLPGKRRLRKGRLPLDRRTCAPTHGRAGARPSRKMQTTGGSASALLAAPCANPWPSRSSAFPENADYGRVELPLDRRTCAPPHGRVGARPFRKMQTTGGSNSRSTGGPVRQPTAEQELGLSRQHLVFHSAKQAREWQKRDQITGAEGLPGWHP